MNYYQFNIGDYMSHTQHLKPFEDIIYRRLLDRYYLHEKPLSSDIERLARSINMHEQADCIEFVLQEFFYLEENRYHNRRADAELAAYREKSSNCKRAARARWDKNRHKINDLDLDRGRLRTQEESTTKQNTRNSKQHTKNIKFNGKKKYIPSATDWMAWGWPNKPDDEIFNAWLQMREAHGYPTTEAGMQTIGKELNTAHALGFTLNECLGQAELKAWKGFTANWMENSFCKSKSTPQNTYKRDNDTDWAKKRVEKFGELIDHD